MVTMGNGNYTGGLARTGECGHVAAVLRAGEWDADAVNQNRETRLAVVD